MRDDPMAVDFDHPRRPAERPSPVNRFLGGPPLTVLLRLVFVSLLVGALLIWLDIEPRDVLRTAARLVERFWAMGFEAFGQAGHYLLAGAVIVVPVWLVMRLLTMRGSR